jgi:hypothetical protein
MRLLAIVLLTGVITPICGLTGLAQSASSVGPATVWYSEQFTMHSKAVGRDFLIQVAKPVKPQAGKVPVIYLLDGTALFGEAADIVIANGNFGDAAPAYLVGISYPNAGVGEWLSLRNHDLVHVHISDSIAPIRGTGDGALFQKFLMEELRPLIASRYPVDDGKAILAGHSFGGLFAVHMLMDVPGGFSGYLACSPAFWAEPRLLEKASAFHSSDPLRIFLGVGSKEEDQHKDFRMIGNLQDFANKLRDHDSGVNLSFTVFEGKTHGAVVNECLSNGLLFLLPVPPPSATH